MSTEAPTQEIDQAELLLRAWVEEQLLAERAPVWSPEWAAALEHFQTTVGGRPVDGAPVGIAGWQQLGSDLLARDSDRRELAAGRLIDLAAAAPEEEQSRALAYLARGATLEDEGLLRRLGFSTGQIAPPSAPPTDAGGESDGASAEERRAQQLSLEAWHAFENGSASEAQRLSAAAWAAAPSALREQWASDASQRLVERRKVLVGLGAYVPTPSVRFQHATEEPTTLLQGAHEEPAASGARRPAPSTQPTSTEPSGATVVIRPVERILQDIANMGEVQVRFDGKCFGTRPQAAAWMDGCSLRPFAAKAPSHDAAAVGTPVVVATVGPFRADVGAPSGRTTWTGIVVAVLHTPNIRATPSSDQHFGLLLPPDLAGDVTAMIARNPASLQLVVDAVVDALPQAERARLEQAWAAPGDGHARLPAFHRLEQLGAKMAAVRLASPTWDAVADAKVTSEPLRHTEQPVPRATSDDVGPSLRIGG